MHLAKSRWWRPLLAVATVSCLAVIAAPPADAQWAEQYWIKKLDVPKAWSITKGQGITVAVVDSGVVNTLGDLRGQLLPGTDINRPGSDGRSDPGTDCHTTAGGCYSHGTDMSLIIAGTGAGKGYQGVAPEAKILPVKTSASTADEISASAIAKGIEWAVDHGAKVINVSLGHDGPCDPLEGPAVKYAYDHDVIVVAAAGNEGLGVVQSPANCPGALAVTATNGGNPNELLGIWSGSNYGPQVAFAGAGVDMPQEMTNGVKVLHANGTSQATAITSAELALIRAHSPTMSARDVVTHAIWSVHSGAGVDRLGQRIDDKIGFGEILPYIAMTKALPANAANPIYDAWAKEFATQPTTNAPSGSGTTSSSPTGPIQAPSPQHQADSGSSSGSGLIIGVIVGVLVLLVIVVLVVLRRRGTGATRA